MRREEGERKEVLCAGAAERSVRVHVCATKERWGCGSWMRDEERWREGGRRRRG